MSVTTVPVFAQPTMTLTASRNSALVGNMINYSISEANESGKAQYRFIVIKDSSTVTDSGYVDANIFSFTPAASGTYTVKIYGKDGLSINDYDSIKQFNINVSTKPFYLSILPLSYGMKNNDVVSLQNALVKLGYAIPDPLKRKMQ